MSNNQSSHVSSVMSGTTPAVSIKSQGVSARFSSAADSMPSSPIDPRSTDGHHGDSASRRAAFHAVYTNTHVASPRTSVPNTPSSTSSVSSHDTFDALFMNKADTKKDEKAKGNMFDFSYKNVHVSGGANGRKTAGAGSGAGAVGCDLM